MWLYIFYSILYYARNNVLACVQGRGSWERLIGNMRQDFHIAFAQGRNQRDKGESPTGEGFEIKAGHTTRKLVENYGFIYSCNFSGQISP